MDKVAIVGAGPAGLTAAWELTSQGWPVTVLEADPTYVGGLARTVRYKDYYLDIGGHRFFSKSKEIEALWSEMMPEGLVRRPRKSRIYHAGRFVSYPLKPFNVFSQLGPLESAACAASYLKAYLFPVENPDNYEAWIVNKFGQRLYRHFFKSYTEKVWGIDCDEISADWAAQRIKGFSLGKALASAVPGRRKGPVETTLIDAFRYPRKGPGMLWETAAETLKQRGASIEMGRRVTRIDRLENGHYRVEHQGVDGSLATLEAAHVVSSAPLSEVVRSLRPPLPSDVIDVAGSLRYRALILVALVGKDPRSFDDTWIYIQDERVKMGRVQNYKAWSPEMVPHPDQIVLGCEYFCNEGDERWNMSDEALIDQASSELDRIGLLPRGNLLDGYVVRQSKAYPVYDRDYVTRVGRLMDALRRDFPNLHLVGRNGLHRYNNQDHSMMTALLTARNIMAGKEQFDVLRVNQEAEYIEEYSPDQSA